MTRILNKNTSEIFYGTLDPEFTGKSFYALVEIPDDGKFYKFENGKIVLDIEREQTHLATLTIQNKIIAIQNLLSTADTLYLLIFGGAIQTGIQLIQQTPSMAVLNNVISAINLYPIPSGLTAEQIQAVNYYKTQLLHILEDG